VLAMPFAALMSGKALTAKELARRVLLFPPMPAFVAALLLRGVPLPPAVLEPLHGLSLTLSPVALVAVGLQLELGALATWRRELAVGLTYKLLLAPLLVLLLLKATGPSWGLLERVAFAQGAMAPMVTGAVIASQRNLEPTLASLMVGVGVVLSLLTVPLWWALSGL
jgi:malate permease and related proteins